MPCQGLRLLFQHAFIKGQTDRGMNLQQLVVVTMVVEAVIALAVSATGFLWEKGRGEHSASIIGMSTGVIVLVKVFLVMEVSS